MTLQTSDERSLVIAMVKGNRFAVTGFDVRTPQDGSAPDTLTIYAQSWIDRGDDVRVSVTGLQPMEYIGQAQIDGLLERVGALYEQYHAGQVTRAQAQYLALRDALAEALKTEGRFPSDANPIGFSVFV